MRFSRWSLILAGGALCGLLACSDDSEDPPTADSGVDGAVVDMKTTPKPDAGGPDKTVVDMAVDTTSGGCAYTGLGKACTTSGGECAKGHTCLMIGSSKGYCTCSCTVDSPSTSANDDTCPGSDTVCVAYAASGSTSKKPYCFKSLGGTRQPSASSWWSAEKTAPRMMGIRSTPAAYPFTLLGIQYRLVGGSKYCHTGMKHRVDVSVSSAAQPETTPTVKATFPVAAVSTPTAQRDIVQALTTPLTLTSGQKALLIMEMTVDTSASTMVCLMSGGTNEVFRSDAVKTPYTWTKATGAARLSGFGF